MNKIWKMTYVSMEGVVTFGTSNLPFYQVYRSATSLIDEGVYALITIEGDMKNVPDEWQYVFTHKDGMYFCDIAPVRTVLETSRHILSTSG